MQTENMSLRGPLASKGPQAFRNREARVHKRPNLWYVVADSEKALIYRRDGQDIERIGEASPHIPYTKQQGNADIGRRMTRKGMITDAHGTNKGVMTPSYESAHHEEMLFFKSLAAYLEDALNKDGYQELAIIAAPKTLGDLRKVLPERVKECVTTEIDKDLVNIPEQELERRLAELG